MKNKKSYRSKFLISIAIVVIATFLFCIVTRATYNYKINNYEEQQNAYVWCSDLASPEYLNIDNKIIELDSANYILKVKKESSENAHSSTISKVKVTGVIKGEDIKMNDEIAIIETKSFLSAKFDSKIIYSNSLSATNLMNNKDEYIVFLNEKQYDKAYSETLETKVFCFCDISSDCSIASFNLNSNQTEFIDREPEFAQIYPEISKNEFLCFSKKSLDNANKLKSMVIDKYIK